MLLKTTEDLHNSGNVLAIKPAESVRLRKLHRLVACTQTGSVENNRESSFFEQHIKLISRSLDSVILVGLNMLQNHVHH